MSVINETETKTSPEEDKSIQTRFRKAVEELEEIIDDINETLALKERRFLHADNMDKAYAVWEIETMAERLSETFKGCK